MASLAAALGFGPELGHQRPHDDDDTDYDAADAEADIITYSIIFPPGTTPQQLLQRRAEWLEFAAAATAEYVWNEQAFCLVPIEPSCALGRKLHLEGSILRGRTRLGAGGCIDDEWLITWLLLRISLQHPEVVVHVRDTDGDFIAIEAADHLPSWIEPEEPGAEFRTYLFRGEVHFVPPGPKRSKRGAGVPSTFAGLDSVSSMHCGAAWVLAAAAAAPTPPAAAVISGANGSAPASRASGAVQAAIQARVGAYPAAIGRSTHTARVFLPALLARLLQREPQLLQPALGAFLGRDPTEARVAARMRVFQPHPLVPVSLRLSRLQYASLAGTVYHPPKAALSQGAPLAATAAGSPDGTLPAALLAAAGVAGRPIPPSSHRDYSQYELGLKITAGFEILMWAAGARGAELHRALSAPPTPTVWQQALLERLRRDGSADLPSSPGYLRFLASLRSNGYFESAHTAEERRTKEASALAYYSRKSGGIGARAVASGTAEGGVLLAAAADLSEFDEEEGDGGASAAPHPSSIAADGLVSILALLERERCPLNEWEGRPQGAPEVQGDPISALTPLAPWPPSCSRNDSDGWLSDPGELEARLGGLGLGGAARGSPGTEGLGQLVQSMSEFMSKMSGYQGAEAGRARGSGGSDTGEGEGGSGNEGEEEGEDGSDGGDEEEEDDDGASVDSSDEEDEAGDSGAAAVDSAGAEAPASTAPFSAAAEAARFLSLLHAHLTHGSGNQKPVDGRAPADGGPPLPRWSGADTDITEPIDWAACALELDVLLPRASQTPSLSGSAGAAPAPAGAGADRVSSGDARAGEAGGAQKRVSWAAAGAPSPSSSSLFSTALPAATDDQEAGPAPRSSSSSDDGAGGASGDQPDIDKELSLRDYMDAMDAQLLYGPSATDSGDDGASRSRGEAAGGLRSSFARLVASDDEDGEQQPTPATSSLVPSTDPEIQFNLLTSLAESVGAQAGGSGPASNLYGDLGVKVPRAWWRGAAGAGAGEQLEEQGHGQCAAASVPPPSRPRTELSAEERLLLSALDD